MQCFVRADRYILLASAGLLSGLLITDNTLDAAVNPGFCEPKSGSDLVGTQDAGLLTVLEECYQGRLLVEAESGLGAASFTHN